MKSQLDHSGYLIIIILHKRIFIKLCQICLSSAIRNVVWVNLYFMLAVNIKFCIANFSTGILFKIHVLIKKFFFCFFFFIKKSREIRNSGTKEIPFE